MNIAVCISGQVRSGVRSSENIKRFIGDLLPNTDFFLHTWNINSPPPMITEELELDFAAEHLLSLNDICAIMSAYKPKKLIVQPFKQFRHSILKRFIGQDYPLFPLFHSWAQSVRLMQEFSDSTEKKYDIVLKIRPDVVFSEDMRLQTFIDYFLEYNDDKLFMSDYVWTEHKDNVRTCNDFVFMATQSTMSDLARSWDNKYSWGDIDDTASGLSVHNQFARYVMEHYTLAGFNEPPDQEKWLRLTILRDECRYNAMTEYNKCAEYDKITYQTVVTNISELKFISKEELIEDSVILMEARGYLPPILKQAYTGVFI